MNAADYEEQRECEDAHNNPDKSIEEILEKEGRKIACERCMQTMPKDAPEPPSYYCTCE